MYVKVGITSKADGEVLMIANVHEFGVNIDVTDKMRAFFRYKFGVNLKKDTINIPERSFIRTGFDANEDKIGDSMEDLIGLVLDGNLSAKAFYNMLGQTTAQAIALHLRDEVNSPPNSGLTIQNKGSSNVLVDSLSLIHI